MTLPARRLEPGDPAPAFVLVDADSRPVSLADLAGRRGVVSFSPAAGTPGCTRQAGDVEGALPELQRAGVAVVGVSPDPPAALAAFRDAEGLTFPLLSDADHAAVTAYGAWGEKLYGRTVTGVLRSTVVVDEQGVVPGRGDRPRRPAPARPGAADRLSRRVTTVGRTGP